MLRKILSIVAGVLAWGVVVTAINLVLRRTWADYAAVEQAMTFTVPMMIARLSESGVSSLVSGYISSLVSKERVWASLLVELILLAVFIPIHLQLWPKFPVWYHLTFLTSLPLLSVLGGRLRHFRMEPG